MATTKSINPLKKLGGTGRFHSSGSWKSTRKFGTAGGIRKMVYGPGGRKHLEYQNISPEDAKIFADIWGKDLKKLSPYATSMPRSMRIREKWTARQAMLKGVISKADYHDFCRQVDSMAPSITTSKTTTPLQPKPPIGRAVHFITDDKTGQNKSLPPRTKAYIKEDIAKEAIELEQKPDPLQNYCHPASSLSRTIKPKSKDTVAKKDTTAKREGLETNDKNKSKLIEIDIG